MYTLENLKTSKVHLYQDDAAIKSQMLQLARSFHVPTSGIIEHPMYTYTC